MRATLVDDAQQECARIDPGRSLHALTALWAPQEAVTVR